MTDEELLVKQLHELADWVEKHNGVHCHSVPRKAAYTIEILHEQNKKLLLQLNKKSLTIVEIVNRYIGNVRLYIYLLRETWKKKP